MKYDKLVRIGIVVGLLLAALVTVAQEEAVTHVVQRGENLFRIALRYGIELDELAAANDISNPAQIYAGQELIIPGLSAPDSGDEIENPLIAAAPIIHVVQRGEYLGGIADLYGVTVDEILLANSIGNPNTIYPGQELQIWSNDVSIAPEEAAPQVVAESTPEAAAPQDEILPTATPESVLTHIVQPGEHLSIIGRNYGVPWTDIAEANNIVDPNRVFAGMELVIPGASAAAGAQNQSSTIIESVPTVAENLPDPGAHWGVGRELVVDLSTQMAYAYENGALQYSALVSTGLPATPTVQGEFSIWHKTPSQTMSGPGYYLPNVQWVMYFYQGYGFHGTYWHNNFGHPMSHGCVNMTNADALWFYNFASLGTPVYVQY